MLETLKLNIAAIPIGIVPYRKVLNKVWTGQAIVLENYEGTCIRFSGYCPLVIPGCVTTNKGIEMPIPSVIQYTHTDYMPKFTRTLPFNRKNVYLRDGGRCLYCGKKVSLGSMSFDHVIPRNQGGKTCWENVVIACYSCNAKKGARHPNKFKWPLIMPYAPKLDKAAPVHLVNKIAGEIIEKTWADYLYWRIVLEP